MQESGVSTQRSGLPPAEAAALDLTKTELGYLFATRGVGSASPLFGLTIIPTPRVTKPLLVDPTQFVFYVAAGSLLIDPFGERAKNNEVLVRWEINGLLHCRSALGAWKVE